MSCPKCKCKETYCYDEGDDMPGGDERMERCAACGHIFDIEDALPEDDDITEVEKHALDELHLLKAAGKPVKYSHINPPTGGAA